MPPGSSNVPGGYHKPRPDLYTVLLIVALLALAIGTIFLYAETAQYQGAPTHKDAPSPRVELRAPAGATAAWRHALAWSCDAVQGGCQAAA